MKKITILDAYTPDVDDDFIKQLEPYGKVSFYKETLSGDIFDYVKGSNCIFTDDTSIDRELISCCNDLEYIGIMATGADAVDIKAAAAKGIAVTNVPGYSSESVAQHTFALILSLTNNIQNHSAFVRDGFWNGEKEKHYWDYPHVELRGKTLGIIGYGNISREIIKIASGFRMKVLIWSERSGGGSNQIKFVSKERLLQESDIISIHKPFTKDNVGLIGIGEIASMKRGAILVNTARGGLVNELALANALQSKQIRAAALDVMQNEPPDKNNPLLKCENCLLTPHIGFAGEKARLILRKIIVDNYADFLNGKNTNRIE